MFKRVRGHLVGTHRRQSLYALVWGGIVLLSAPAWALEFSDIASEGQIKFFKTRPDPGAYAYASHVSITPASLETGSVSIATCHDKLDEIRKVVIVFNPDRIQSIQIKRFEKIGSASVQNNEVVLTDVAKGASICIDLQSKALDRLGNGQFKLNAGPLMRRYFDGYLPMSASLTVSWPTDLLSVEKTVPSAQDGIQIDQNNQGIKLDMVFAGKMTAQIFLKQTQMVSLLGQFNRD